MTGSRLTRALGSTMAAAAALAAFAAPASASPTPPAPDARFAGTWVNTNSSTLNVKQIDIVFNGAGGMNVDGFGSCSPSLCEFGLVPAILYGSNVSAGTGTSFQTNQRFLSGDTEFARIVLLGKLTSSAAGPRLKVREMTVFTDGSGRHNYTVTETFAPGEGQAASLKGNPAADYPLGAPPAPVAGLFGRWTNPSATPALAGLTISAGPGGAPLVQGFGACSPTPCDFGTVEAITYGTSISSAKGRTVLAPYSFGFKNEQLVIVYAKAADGSERLTVSNYSEFTDASGRSNYTRTETLVRA